MDNQIITAFIEVFKSQPALFSSEDLQDLDRTLNRLDPHNINALYKGIQDWYKQRPLIRNEVVLRLDSLREMNRVPFHQTEAGDMVLQNRYRELPDEVKERIKNQETEAQQIQSNSKDES